MKQYGKKCAETIVPDFINAAKEN